MKDNKDFEVVILPECQAQIDADPELAKAMREFSAIARQAAYGVESGQYKDFNEGMEMLTGNKPVRLDDDDLGGM